MNSFFLFSYSYKVSTTNVFRTVSKHFEGYMYRTTIYIFSPSNRIRVVFIYIMFLKTDYKFILYNLSVKF